MNRRWTMPILLLTIAPLAGAGLVLGDGAKPARGPMLPAAIATMTKPPAPPAESRMVIGVHVAEVGDALASHLGIDPDHGILIHSVVDGLPAAKAGVEPFDVITAIAGEPVRSRQSLAEALDRSGAGATLMLTLRRHGDTLEVPVTVTEQTDAADAPTSQAWLRIVAASQLAKEQELVRAQQASLRDHAALARLLSEVDQQAATNDVEHLEIHRPAIEDLRRRLAMTEATLAENLARLDATRAKMSAAQQEMKDAMVAREKVLASHQDAAAAHLDRQLAEQLAASNKLLADALASSRLPRVELRDDGADGRVALLLDTERLAGAARAADVEAGKGAVESRLAAIEERLARIENLLQRMSDEERREQ